MRLLIPDADYPQRPDMLWCLPVSEREFDKLNKLSDTFKCHTQNGVSYVHSIGKGRKQIILVLWNKHVHTEDEVKEGCAWIRLIKDKQQPIYIVPCQHGDDAELTTPQIVNRSMGALPEQVQSLDSITVDERSILNIEEEK